MIYRNDDPMAILAMEEERTGNYGGDVEEDRHFIGYCECPGCESEIWDDDVFYDVTVYGGYDAGKSMIVCEDCMDRIM